MSNTGKTNGEYEVGYGKPPVASRFRKGQSGNSRGRVRGRKNLKTELLEELSGKVTLRLTKDGPLRTLPRQTLVVKRMVTDAIMGNAKARDQLLRLVAQVEAAIPASEASDPIGAAKDAEILARFRAELVNEIQGSHK